MDKKALRKKLYYDRVIKKYSKFHIPLPNRKAIKIMNSPWMSNLLESTYEDFSTNKLLMLDKFTQTPYEKNTQTGILDKETQEDYQLQHHDLYPHLYYKIDAMSKPIPHDTNIVIQNDATSQTVDKTNNINQTSTYIPNSLKQKTDNINQTVRYMLKDITPQDELSRDYQDWYDSLRRVEPTQEVEPDTNPGLFDWLINLALPNPPEIPSTPPSNPSQPPSVPSPSIQSPSEAPVSSTPPSPPSSPSPVAYPASVSSSSSRRSGSMKSGKKQK